MNKQELIEAYKRISTFCDKISVNKAIRNLEQIDEPSIYVKNILARLRELPLRDREVWLKAIMGEFEQDFSHAKWREGYEQGKFEGAWVGQQLKDADKIRRELNRPIVPQFVAEWYEKNKDDFETNLFTLVYEIFKKRNDNELTEMENWLIDEHTKPFSTLVKMQKFGYKVEEEKRYKVVMPNVSSSGGVLTRIKHDDSWIWIDTLGTIVEGRTHTRKELEEADFGWVFDCEGIEVEEVE